MSLTFCKVITIPLLVCLASPVIFVAPARAEAVILQPAPFELQEVPVFEPTEPAEPTEPTPEPSSDDGGGGGSSSGLAIAAAVVVVGGLGLWWWLSRDKKEKTVIDMEARNHLYEHYLNEATSLTFDAGPTPRMFMGHQGDRDELKMEDLACGEVGLRVVF
jgi:hypothetical protein